VPDWLLAVAREFPITLLLGVAGWWLIRLVREQHEAHLAELRAVYERHLASKDEEIRRLSRQLTDAQKDRRELVDRLTARGDD
jgi:hypothetical protein